MHPRTYSESLDLIGPAICASIDDEQQDSLCIYLKGSLRSPLDYLAIWRLLVHYSFLRFVESASPML